MGLVAVLGFAMVSGGWLPLVLLLALAIGLHGRISARYSATADQQRRRFLLLSLPIVSIVFFQLMSTRLNFQTPQFIAVSGTVYILACGILEMYRVPREVRPANYHLSMITAVFVAGISAQNQTYPFFLLAYFGLAVQLLRNPYGGWWRREGIPQPSAPLWGIVLAFGLSLSVAIPARFILPGLGRALTQMYTQSLLNGALGNGIMFGNVSDLNGTLRNARSRLLVLRVSGPPTLLRAQVYQTYQSGRWQAPPVTRQNRLELKADSQGIITLPGPAPRLRHWSIAPVLDISGPLPVCPDPYQLSGLESLNLEALDSLSADAFEPYQVWGSNESQTRSPRGPSPQDPAYLQVPEELRQPLKDWAGPVAGGDPVTLLTNELLQNGVYDAEARRPPGIDPVLGFIQGGLHGHCELFASTLALSLRLQGIPTRYVAGFQMSEYNALSKNYLVRERDTHAWVEVYRNGHWLTCDPTPASQTLAAHPDGFQLEFGDQVVDWVRGIWAAFLSGLRRSHLPAWPILFGGAALLSWLGWRFRGLLSLTAAQQPDELSELLKRFEGKARQQRYQHETVLEYASRLPKAYADWLKDYARARFAGLELNSELASRLEKLPAIEKIQPPFSPVP
ncbi:transglutaminase domain-containing protein [bacterium]|nr:transglutaminase domain-containing protein [bacterium]